MTSSESCKNLPSFLGLVNYLARYSGDWLMAPLQELTKKDIAYGWGPEHITQSNKSNKKSHQWEFSDNLILTLSLSFKLM